ncbi:MAG: IS4 family transposase, partial [Opitutales bacterium]
MDDSSCLKEDWELLVSFFPEDWRALASASGAVKGLRQDKDEERLLRTLLLHVGCGHSLRETAVRARQAGLADLSDVALLKRLRKSEAWLRALCERLFAERGIGEAVGPFGALRLIDATRIEEPGKTGSSWRIHYSLAVPSLRCDFFELTPVKGKGTGESLKRY